MIRTSKIKNGLTVVSGLILLLARIFFKLNFLLNIYLLSGRQGVTVYLWRSEGV